MKKLFKAWISGFIYPKPFVGILYLPRYIKHWIKYSRFAPIAFLDSYPCLGDWTDHTPFDAHYFYQAAWVSRSLARKMPKKHTDIGSDVKLIGVISAFIPVEFIDYRPLKVELSGLECKGGDILSLSFPDDSIESISCLHVVEHIGLGRYGDALDADGSKKALKELERVLMPGGRLYLSMPVGRERVCFNAHRVYSVQSILQMLPRMNLISLALIDDDGKYIPSPQPDSIDQLNYGCGLFVMEKIRS